MRKIIFEPDYWKSPANGLVAALQERLKEILQHPKEFGVRDAHTLKSVMLAEAEALASEFKRSPISDVKFKVHTLEGYDDQFFEMEHKRDNMLLSARCQFNLGGRQFHASLNTPVPGRFGRIIIEF